MRDERGQKIASVNWTANSEETVTRIMPKNHEIIGFRCNTDKIVIEKQSVMGISNLALVLWSPSKDSMNLESRLEVQLEERELFYM